LFHLSKEQKDDQSGEFTVKNEYSPGKTKIFSTTKKTSQKQ